MKLYEVITVKDLNTTYRRTTQYVASLTTANKLIRKMFYFSISEVTLKWPLKQKDMIDLLNGDAYSFEQPLDMVVPSDFILTRTLLKEKT
jgi:hypothetical protein